MRRTWPTFLCYSKRRGLRGEGMNWDAVSAVGEVRGAVGVIATLAYLSVQIRQNTKAIRSSALSAVTQYQMYEIRWGAEIGASMRKALHTPDAMSEDDVWQVSSSMPEPAVVISDAQQNREPSDSD